jgi:hypothetical protein
MNAPVRLQPPRAAVQNGRSHGKGRWNWNDDFIFELELMTGHWTCSAKHVPMRFVVDPHITTKILFEGTVLRTGVNIYIYIYIYSR